MAYQTYTGMEQSQPSWKNKAAARQKLADWWDRITADPGQKHPVQQAAEAGHMSHAMAPTPQTIQPNADSWNGMLNFARANATPLAQNYVQQPQFRQDLAQDIAPPMEEVLGMTKNQVMHSNLQNWQNKKVTDQQGLVDDISKAPTPTKDPVYDAEKSYADQLKAHFQKSIEKRQESLDYANKLRDVFAQNMGDAQVDYSPLLALVDSETGSQLSKGYKVPDTLRKRIGQLEAMRRSAAQEERGISQDMLGLIKAKALGAEARARATQRAEDKQKASDLNMYQKAFSQYRGEGRGLTRSVAKLMEQDRTVNRGIMLMKDYLSKEMKMDKTAAADISAALTSLITNGNVPPITLIGDTMYKSLGGDKAAVIQYLQGDPEQYYKDPQMMQIFKQFYNYSKSIKHEISKHAANVHNRYNRIRKRNPDLAASEYTNIGHQLGRIDKNGMARPRPMDDPFTAIDTEFYPSSADEINRYWDDRDALKKQSKGAELSQKYKITPEQAAQMLEERKRSK